MQNITPHPRIYDHYFGVLQVLTLDELAKYGCPASYQGPAVGVCGELCALCHNEFCKRRYELYSVYRMANLEYVAVFDHIIDESEDPAKDILESFEFYNDLLKAMDK